MTDDTWKSLGIASECLGLTRADYLEHIVRHNANPCITREEEEFLAPHPGENEPQPSITRQREFPLTSDTESERQSVALPTISELEILRDRILSQLKLGKQWGTWDGHKYKYNQVQKELRKVLDEFIKNKDCDDDNDPDGYGAREGYDLAWEYVDLKSPSELRPKNQGEAPPWAISWIEELGGTIKDGAIIVGQGASEAALTILSLIAGILMMPLRQHAY